MVGQIEQGLQAFLNECVGEAERLFGERDERYGFPTIERRTDGESSPFLDVKRKPELTVFLPESCLVNDDLSEARWHIAHEAVHVLDPHCNPTSYLEEGLASWFQNEKVKEYRGPRSRPWFDAEQLVIPWMHVLPGALKRFRNRQRKLREEEKRWTKLGDMSETMLVCCCPEVGEKVDQLVARFPKRPAPVQVPESHWNEILQSHSTFGLNRK